MAISKYGWLANQDGKDKWGIESCDFPEYNAVTCCTFVYSEVTQHWLGMFSYNFDKYTLMEDGVLYGMKNGETYILNSGNNIDDVDIVAWVLTAASPEQVSDKEFLRIRINSDNKPDRVDFYTSMDEFNDGTASAILDPTSNPLHLKDYFGFEQYIPRKVDGGNRMQGRVLLYKITHGDSTKDFTLVDTEIQYKTLK